MLNNYITLFRYDVIMTSFLHNDLLTVTPMESIFKYLSNSISFARAGLWAKAQPGPQPAGWAGPGLYKIARAGSGLIFCGPGLGLG